MNPVPHRHDRRAATRAPRPISATADAGRPINLAIESLVLHGVRRSDAAQVAAAFRTELARLVVAPRTALIARTAAEMNAGTIQHASGADALGRGAAAAVMRGLRS
jgi:hypothetical protein